MTKKYILAIDQGTTSTRAILFDADGIQIGTAQKELPLSYPQNGWVEQNPEDIWQDTQYVCGAVLHMNSIDAAQVACIGITNQRETTIVWNRKTGAPVYNAIVWQDRRTAAYCDALRGAGHEAAMTAKTGLVIDPYFSASKIRWILDNTDVAADDLAFGTVDCFLLWRMTGGAVHATDATNASRTQLFNIVTQDWDDELLKLFGIPRGMLPEVKDSSAHFGDTDVNFIGASVPVTGIAGDQQAAMVGQACFLPGMVKSTYGTGCFVLANIGGTFRQSKNRMLTTVAYRLNGKTTYALEGAIFVAGAAVQWLRDGLGIIKSSSETQALAQSVPDNGGVYLVPAFTGLGAPHWNPHARGSITGLTRASTAAHIARATLEAQAYQTQDLIAAMRDDADMPIAEIRVDGGMVKNDWLCQILADITQTPVLRPSIIETTALGAAYLAGLHVGIFKSLDDIAAKWRRDRLFEAQMDAPTRDALYAGWQHAVRQTLA